MRIIKQKYIINAPVKNVWAALVDPKIISAWGGGPAKMDGKSGTHFSLWDGDIHGTNKKVIPGKLLTQQWYSEDWPQASKATFKLSHRNSNTIIDFTHELVPEYEVEKIEQGWKDFYLGKIKQYLEKDH